MPLEKLLLATLTSAVPSALNTTGCPSVSSTFSVLYYTWYWDGGAYSSYISLSSWPHVVFSVDKNVSEPNIASLFRVEVSMRAKSKDVNTMIIFLNPKQSISYFPLVTFSLYLLLHCRRINSVFCLCLMLFTVFWDGNTYRTLLACSLHWSHKRAVNVCDGNSWGLPLSAYCCIPC